MAKNVASSGFTPVQAGRIVQGGKPAKPAKPAKPERKPESGGRDRGNKPTVTNVRSGNARVGVQADEVNGSITVWMR